MKTTTIRLMKTEKMLDDLVELYADEEGLGDITKSGVIRWLIRQQWKKEKLDER